MLKDNTFEVKLKLNQKQSIMEKDIKEIFGLMKEIADYYVEEDEEDADENPTVVLDTDYLYYPEVFDFLEEDDIPKVKKLMKDNPGKLKLKLRVYDELDKTELDALYSEFLSKVGSADLDSESIPEYDPIVHKLTQKLLSTTFVLSIPLNASKSTKNNQSYVSNQKQSTRKKEGKFQMNMNMNMNFDALNIKETKDYGVNVLNHQIAYNGNTYADGMLVTGPTLDIPMYVMPVVDVVPGDVIEYEDEPFQVLEVKPKEIKAVSLVSGQIEVIAKKNILGMGSFFKKVVNPMTAMTSGIAMQPTTANTPNGQNPLMSMLLMNAMFSQNQSNDTEDTFKNIMMLQMLGGMPGVGNMFGGMPQNVPVAQKTASKKSE